MKTLKTLLIFILALMLSACKTESRYTTRDANCIDDLSGKRVAVLTGGLHDILMSQRGDAQLLRLSSPAEIIVAVQKNRADYCMQDSASFISCNAEEKGVGLAFSCDFVKGDACLAFQKKDTALCNKFNKFLSVIKANGVYDQMTARWSKGDVRLSDIPADVQPPKVSPLGPKPIVIGIMDNFPFTFIKNGDLSGFEIEMMNRFSQYYDLPIIYENYEFSSLIASLVTGKIDIICSFLFKTEERAQKVLFSDSYYYSQTAVFGYLPKNMMTDKSHVVERIKDGVNDNLVVEKRYELILHGLLETIKIAFLSILFGTILGAVCCRMLFSRRKFVRGIVEVFHGFLCYVPFLVFLMILFYVVFSKGGMTGEWVSIIAFTISFALQQGTMFHSSINNIGKGQWEAGTALGFPRFKTFIYIILPQAMHFIMPAFKGNCISLIKGTAIVGYIAVHDLTKVSDIIRSRTFDAFFPLFVITVIYFLLAFLLGKVLEVVSKKF